MKSKIKELDNYFDESIRYRKELIDEMCEDIERYKYLKELLKKVRE